MGWSATPDVHAYALVKSAGNLPRWRTRRHSRAFWALCRNQATKIELAQAHPFTGRKFYKYMNLKDLLKLHRLGADMQFRLCGMFFIRGGKNSSVSGLRSPTGCNWGSVALRPGSAGLAEGQFAGQPGWEKPAFYDQLWIAADPCLAH